MKLAEIVEPKPTGKELYDRDVFDRKLDPGQVYVTGNQKDAFVAYIMARLREMVINPKHIHVSWSSSLQATAFPTAGIRFIVKNPKSKQFDDAQQPLTFPTICKALTKNAFRDVFGFNVKVERENLVGEYSNGWRFIDFKVDWA